MNKINRNRIIAVLITAMLITLTACGGKDTQEVIALNAETTEENSESAEEIITETEEPILTYVEENGLTFTDETKVQTQGTLCIGNDTDNADIINVDWELSNISISDSEDGIQIVLNQSVYGYIWSDGNIYKTNLNLPSALLCDINTGKLIPMTEEIKTKEIEWDEQKISITTLETENWEDGNSSDWEDDPSGGERLPSTLKVTDTIKVTKDYDALALVLVPITSSDNIVGSYINDVWSDGCYLFSISDLSAKFEQIKDVQIAESEEGEEEEEIKQEEIKTAENSPKETTATKEEEQKISHTHNYNGVVTVQATCVTNGVKTYTCSCGDSYTENLGTTAHDYSIPITESVYHEEVWQVTERQLSEQKVYWCGCGAEYTNVDEFEAHRVANVEANGPFVDCAGNYMIYTRPGETVYDRVKVSDAYTSEEIVGYKCSVCGATTQ